MFLLFESYMAGLGLTFLAHCASLQIVTIGRTDAKERIIARANALYLKQQCQRSTFYASVKTILPSHVYHYLTWPTVHMDTRHMCSL